MDRLCVCVARTGPDGPVSTRSRQRQAVSAGGAVAGGWETSSRNGMRLLDQLMGTTSGASTIAT